MEDVKEIVKHENEVEQMLMRLTAKDEESKWRNKRVYGESRQAIFQRLFISCINRKGKWYFTSRNKRKSNKMAKEEFLVGDIVKINKGSHI